MHPETTPLPTPPELGPDFRSRLRDWRTAAGITQSELAELTGLGERTIRRWETPPTDPQDTRPREPTGKAAETWEAFRDGTLLSDLNAEIHRLSERRRKLSEIFFQDPGT